jgi:hypothetical protein
MEEPVMRRHPRAHVSTALAAAVFVVVATSACSGASNTSANGSITSASASSPAPIPSTTAADVEKVTEDLDRSRFAHPTVVDNRWFPLEPGTQLVFTGSSLVDGERVPHRVIFTVTDQIKEIDGLQTVVVYERDYTRDHLDEAELAFFAQDDDGTVWQLGEYPEEYEDNKFVEAPTWIPGQQGAKAGIAMKAEPQLGKPSYSQGWGPAVDWKDRAQLIKTQQKTCVPAGCYSDLIVIQEFTKSEPDSFQLKFYAPGVGNVRVGWAGSKEEEKEVLRLIKASTLRGAALSKMRKAALALEKHGYLVSKKVFGTTSPMHSAAGS